MKTYRSLQSNILRLCMALPLAAMVTGCSVLPHNEAGSANSINHVVVVWLKHHGNVAERNRIIEASKSFHLIPGVTRVTTGPVLPSRHPGNDSSFDVAVVITFKDQKSLADYGKNPAHLKAVKELLMPLASRYVIYDFANQ